MIIMNNYNIDGYPPTEAHLKDPTELRHVSTLDLGKVFLFLLN